MKKKSFLLAIIGSLLLATISFSFSKINNKSNKMPDGGTIVGGGRCPAIVRIYVEKPDNTKGTQLLPERWLQRDERIPLQTETGRIIYDYRYDANDTWKENVHAWLHNGEETKIP